MIRSNVLNDALLEFNKNLLIFLIQYHRVVACELEVIIVVVVSGLAGGPLTRKPCTSGSSKVCLVSSVIQGYVSTLRGIHSKPYHIIPYHTIPFHSILFYSLYSPTKRLLEARSSNTH